MFTVAQDRLLTPAQQQKKNVSTHLFGQEVNPETYAIYKADMLLKGDGDQAEHISYGSTFPNTNALRSQLTWTHYRLLLSVENEQANS